MFGAIDRCDTLPMILSSSHPASPESSEAARMLTLEIGSRWPPPKARAPINRDIVNPIDDSISHRRRVALRQRTSISARAGSPSIDLIDITPELTGSPTLCGSSIAMMQPADLRD